MKNFQLRNKFILYGIIISIVIWISISIVRSLFFPETTLLKELVFPEMRELLMRGIVIIFVLAMSYYAKRSMDLALKYKDIERLADIQRNLSLQLGLNENIDETLQTCLDTAIELSEMDSGAIYLINEVTGEITLEYSRGLSDEFIKKVNYYPPDSENALLLKLGKLKFFPPDELANNKDSTQNEEKLCSLAVVPVKRGKRVIAALNISSHSRTELTNNTLKAMEGIAAQIGVIIDSLLKGHELIESEKKYRSIVENASEGIVVIGDNFKFTYVNDEFCKILGRSREELLGPDFRNFLTDECEEFVSTNYKKRQRGEDLPSRYSFDIIRKSGEIRNVEMNCSVIETKDGIVTVALILDTTRRKRAEEKYRTLFESSKDAIAVIKPPGWEFVTWNSATSELFSIKDDEKLLLRTPWEMSPETQPDGQESFLKAKEMIEKAMREGSHYFEWTHIDNNGKLIPTTVYLVKIDIEGEEHLLATIRDVSKSKSAQNQMRQLRDYLRSIINSMPSVLIGIDVEGTVVHWNYQAEEITGIKAEDAYGKNLYHIYPEMKNEESTVNDALSSGEIQEDAKVIRYVNDEVHYKNIIVFPVVSGEVKGVVIREDDVTLREKLEEVVTRAEKMASLGGLAAGMAHEINSPLTVIIQNAAVALNRLMEDIPGNIKAANDLKLDLKALREYAEKRAIIEMLDGIKMSGKRAADIVRDMLSFARKEMPEKTLHSVIELLNNSVDLARQDVTLGMDDIKISCEYENDLPDIMCEPGKIQQVFLNVIKNGAEAMKKKNREGYKPEFIFRAYLDEDWVCVQIEDNGPGIDKSLHKRIFEPFFTSKKKGKGAGLGMSVSYFIVTDIHSGMMNVESKKGEWARFIIHLPLYV